MSFDFGWIIALVAVWLFSSIAEGRRKAGKRKRGPRDERPPSPVPSGASTGPAAGRRDLARDLAEGARRAEEALRRWEARQQSRETDEERMAAVDLRRRTAGRMFDVERDEQGAGRAAVRGARESRSEAYEAIREMLSEGSGGAEAEPQRTPGRGGGGRDRPDAVRRPISRSELEAPRPRPSAGPGSADAVAGARMAGMGRSGIGHREIGRRGMGRGEDGRSSGGGLERLDRLPLLQRAVVLRELLGPPKALDPGTDVY